MKPRKLTLKQAKFTKEYLKSGNGAQAAIKAGYSESSAKEIASENLTKPNIQATIQSAAEKLGINPEYVLGNFKEIADFNKQKRLKAKQVNGETFHEEEMIDPQASLKANEMLGKHLALFTEKMEVTGKDGAPLGKEDKLLSTAKKLALIFQNPNLKK